jgi:hypothetical protein
MRDDIHLQPGDLFVVESDSLMGRTISWAENFKDVVGDAKYIHAGVILHSNGNLIESEWHVQISNIDEYAGNKIMIARLKNMNIQRFFQGKSAIIDRVGQRYPILRLFLQLFGLARRIRTKHVVCSELQAQFIGAACPELQRFVYPNYYGWDPAQLAGAYEMWVGHFDIIYQGVW